MIETIIKDKIAARKRYTIKFQRMKQQLFGMKHSSKIQTSCFQQHIIGIQAAINIIVIKNKKEITIPPFMKSPKL